MSGLNEVVQAQFTGSPDTFWRRSRKLPTEKLEYILSTGKFADITFLIGSSCEKIQCHKFVLVMSSSVFEAMFHGGLANPQEISISVPDVEPQAFTLLLKYLYTGKFEVPEEVVVPLMIAADKYNIPDLVANCSSVLKKEISVKNAVTIFQTGELLNDFDLKEQAYSFLIRNFQKILEEQDFLELSLKNLCLFLESDRIAVSELALLEAVLRWAETECARLNRETTIENKRKVLNPAINLIRFPLMSLKDIASKVVPLGILCAEERSSLFQYKALEGDEKSTLPTIPFSTSPRFMQKSDLSFQARFMGMSLVSLSLEPEWMHYLFMVDRNIFLESFGFFGPFHEDSTYEVEIQLENNVTREILAHNTETTKAKRRKIFHVKFKDDIHLKKSILYRASFKLKGPDVFAGNQPEQKVEVECGEHNNIVTFVLPQWGNQLPEICFSLEFNKFNLFKC